MERPESGRPLKAIALMLGAVVAFCAMDTVLKLFAVRYPIIQLMAMRGGASLPFMVLPLLAMGRLRELRPVRFGMHMLRALLMLIVLGGFIYGVRVLSLADTYAIFLAAPLIVTALSVPLLHERIDARRWLAVAIGLVGVIVMLHPSAAHMISVGALAALIAAIGYALNAIAVRVLTRSETTWSVVFWMIGLMTIGAGALAWPNWQPIARADWILLAAIGAFAAVGQHLFTEAFRNAPPSVVAPFEYTALLWGIISDRVVWGILPTSRMYIGGGIVIVSGLYLIARERTTRGASIAAQAASVAPP